MIKEQVLTKLYGIRAGLSVLSVEKGKVSEISENTTARINGLREMQKNIPQRVNELKKEINEIDRKINNRGYDVRRTFSFREDFLKPFLPVFAIWLLFPLSIGLVFVGIKLLDWVFGPWGGLCIIAGVFCSVGTFVWAYCFSLENGEYIQSPKRIKRQADKAKSEIADLNAQKQQLLDKIKKLLQNLEKEKNECQQLQRHSQELVAQKVKSCSLFYQAFVQEYAKYVDERDWQHVDLLIFYFETGRADTLKEGLQLVDRQVQTNSIIQAIRMANAELTRTIQIGLGRIERMIGEGFSLLFSQIGELQRVQNLQLMQLDNLVNSQKISKAVQSRASVDSMRLMEDVRYMRMLAENAEIRRRNNL